MSAKQDLTIYNSWNITIPAIPARSRLFQLEPRGIGTPYVESLTSYIVRLAKAHCLLPTILITKMIAPHLKQTFVKNCTSRSLGILFAKAKTINGCGDIAQDFVRAITILSHNKNLRYLTLLDWSEILMTKGLFRSHKAWCPVCNQKWLCSSTDNIYEPLIWSIKAVKVCTKHNTLLSERCSHCSQKIPLLTWRSRNGFCSNCEEPLVNSRNQAPELITNINLKKQEWIANSIGKILELTPSLTYPVSKNQVKNNLNLAVQVLADGNSATLASSLAVPRNTLWGWCQGKSFPTLDNLLNISFRLNISLADLITKDIEFTTQDRSRERIFEDEGLQRSSPLDTPRFKKRGFFIQ